MVSNPSAQATILIALPPTKLLGNPRCFSVLSGTIALQKGEAKEQILFVSGGLLINERLGGSEQR